MNRPIRLLPAFLSVGSWTMVSRVLGLLRDILMAAFLGTGPVAQAFLIAFTLPNMFRRFFAEGAFNLAFVPMFAKKVEAGEDAEGFARDALSGLGAVLIVLRGRRLARHAVAGARHGERLRRRRALHAVGRARPHRLPLHPLHLADRAAVGRSQLARPLRARRRRADPDERRHDRLPADRLLDARQHRPLADLVGAGGGRSPARAGLVGLRARRHAGAAALAAADAGAAAPRRHRRPGAARGRRGAGEPAGRPAGRLVLRRRRRLALLRRPALPAAARRRRHRHRRGAAARPVAAAEGRRRQGRTRRDQPRDRVHPGPRPSPRPSRSW